MVRDIDETQPRNVAQFVRAMQNAEWRLQAQADEALLSQLEVPSAVLDGAIEAYLSVPLATHVTRDMTEAQRAQQVAVLRTHPRLVSAIEAAYRSGFRSFLRGPDHEEES